MTLETYWLVIAPAVLLGLSLIGWAGLLVVPRQPRRGATHPEREVPSLPDDVFTPVSEMSVSEKMDIILHGQARRNVAFRRLTELGEDLDEQEVKRETRRLQDREKEASQQFEQELARLRAALDKQKEQDQRRE